MVWAGKKSRAPGWDLATCRWKPFAGGPAKANAASRAGCHSYLPCVHRLLPQRRHPGTAAAAKLGILAYGSLIDDPGDEIKALTAGRITGVETPFNVEFARKSRLRADAPTLIRVEQNGSKVPAAIIVLKPEVAIESAQDILYRRETDRVGTNDSPIRATIRRSCGLSR